jgi:hypothetical protein
MKKRWHSKELKLVGVVFVLITAPVSLPFIAFGLIEGTEQDRKKSALLLSLDVAIGGTVHLVAGYPEMRVILFFAICGVIGGFSMEMVHAWKERKEEKGS